MSSLTVMDIFGMSRFLLKCIGLDPYDSGVVAKVNRPVLFGAFATLTVLLFENFLHAKADVEFLATSMVSFTIYYQFASKMFFIFYYKKQIVAIIEEFQQLWGVDVVAGDAEESNNIQTILATYKLCIKLFFCSGLSHTVSFIVIPLLRVGDTLPYQMWLPNHRFYLPIFAVEIYVVLILLFLVVGIDSLFIALCGTLGIQFRLLSHRMKQLKGDLPEEVIKQTLRECILHQKHLLTCFKKVEHMFQFTLCSQYALIVLTICMNLYIISENDDFFSKVSGISYIITIAGELNIYCIMSEIVESESSKFAYAVYETDWYEFRKKSLQQDIHIAMIAMKKPVLFYILGLFPLNMESYVAMLKAAFSYYTVMVQMPSE